MSEESNRVISTIPKQSKAIGKSHTNRTNKKLIFSCIAVIISSLISSLFIFDRLFGWDTRNPVIRVVELSIIILIAYLLLWVGYSGFISHIFKKSFKKTLIKDSITYLPLIILGFFPLNYLVADLGSQFIQFSYLPSAVIFIFAFSSFVFLKVFLLGIKVGNKKSLRNILLVIILIFFMVFSGLSVLKHLSFFSTGHDLGVYDQVMYGYSKGRMYHSLTGYYLLGDHLQWILFLILPIYMVFTSPITLLIIQALFICVGAFILFLISKEVLKNDAVSLIICTVYLIYPTVQYANLFDFHPIVLSLPFIFLSLYSLIKKKYKLLVVSLILVGICKEYLPLIMLPFGIFLFFSKKRVLGCAIALAGIGWFIVNLEVIIPFFYGGKYMYFASDAYFGGSVGEIVMTLLFNPGHVLRYALTLNKLAFLILFPAAVFFGIFALIAPEYLFLGISELAIVLLHTKNSLSNIAYHHSIALVPFTIVATIIGIKRLSGFIKSENIITACSFGILSTAILSNIFLGPFAILYDLTDFNLNKPYVRAGKEILSMIPKDASVVAPNWMLPHLTQREEIYMLRHFLKPREKYDDALTKSPGKDYIIADLSDALTDPKRSARSYGSDELTILFNKKEYGIIAVRDTWILLKLGESYEENICKIKPFLDKTKYPYLNITIKEKELLEKC